MKEKEFTEQDSLELITQMIQQSKRNMKVGNGNILLWLSCSHIVSCCVFSCTYNR